MQRQRTWTQPRPASRFQLLETSSLTTVKDFWLSHKWQCSGCGINSLCVQMHTHTLTHGPEAQAMPRENMTTRSEVGKGFLLRSSCLEIPPNPKEPPEELGSLNTLLSEDLQGAGVRWALGRPQLMLPQGLLHWTPTALRPVADVGSRQSRRRHRNVPAGTPSFPSSRAFHCPRAQLHHKPETCHLALRNNYDIIRTLKVGHFSLTFST